MGQAADVALGKRDRTGERRLSTTPWGGLGLAAINGLVGDALEREQSVLQEPMAVRVDGLSVPCEPSALAARFPTATPTIVVFVHGLMGTEFPWWWGGGPSRDNSFQASRNGFRTWLSFFWLPLPRSFASL